MTDGSGDPAPEKPPTRHLGDLSALGPRRPAAEILAKLAPVRVAGVNAAFAALTKDQQRLSKQLMDIRVAAVSKDFTRGIEARPISMPPPPARAEQIEETNAILARMSENTTAQLKLQAGLAADQRRDTLVIIALAGLAVIADGIPLGWRLGGLAVVIAAWRLWPSSWRRSRNDD